MGERHGPQRQPRTQPFAKKTRETHHYLPQSRRIRVPHPRNHRFVTILSPVQSSPTKLVLKQPNSTGNARPTLTFPAAPASAAPRTPTITEASTPTQAKEQCPHCGRVVLVRSAPRCSFCGEALADGAKNKTVAPSSTGASNAHGKAPPPEFVAPDSGYDAPQREAACARLRGFILRSRDQAKILDLFVRGLQNDFSPAVAEATHFCTCGGIADTIIAVPWSARRGSEEKRGLGLLVALPLDFIMRKRLGGDFHVVTHHAACSPCAQRKGWFDRYERFFGPVPRILRRGRVRLQSFQPGAAEASGRGADLRYELAITRDEEMRGFTRTLRFHRSAAQMDELYRSQATTEVTESVVVPAGWTGGHVRRTNAGFHHALRLAGRGNRGHPAGNDGDLFITITVQD